MRTAIATGQFFKPHETMINRHIEHIFGGDTCVICNEVTKEPRPDKPFINWRAIKHTMLEQILCKPERTRLRTAYHARDIPWGRQRRRLIRFLKREQVEIVLCEVGTKGILIGPIAHELGIPFVVYFRGADATSELNKPDRVAAFRKMSTEASAFISVAQCLLDNLEAHGIAHPRSYIVPSGVDVRRFTPGEKIPKRFVAVGRMIEKKAPLLTLRAFCDVAERDPEATLEMLGGGDLLDEARSYLKMRGLADQVFLRGERPHDDVMRALREAEVFIQHSVVASDGNTEGLPTAIQEAMACGLAIVSTRHAGIPEAVTPHENGLLVDEFDLDGFRDSIRTMLSGEVDVAAMGRVSRARAEERYDNARLLTRTEEILREIARDHAPPRPPPEAESMVAHASGSGRRQAWRSRAVEGGAAQSGAA